MNLSTSSPKPAMVREAYWAGWTCRLMSVVIPLLSLISWYLGTAQMEALQRLGLEATHTLSAKQFVLALTLSLLPVVALSRSLWLIARCFDCFSRSKWFGSNNPRALASAGRWLVAAGLLSLLVPTLLGLVFTLDAASYSGSLVISFSSNAVLSILFGLLLWMLGRLWAKANALALDNARYV